VATNLGCARAGLRLKPCNEGVESKLIGKCGAGVGSRSGSGGRRKSGRCNERAGRGSADGLVLNHSG
jgi:hypothetical protein